MKINPFKSQGKRTNLMTNYLHLCILCLGTVFFSCKKESELAIQPTRQNITESVYASGIIKSQNQYQVFSTVSGLLQEILVKEGDLVKKGSPLFILSNETARLNTENARLAAEFADLATKDDRLNEAQISIETARIRMINDSILWIRQKGLWDQNIGSKIELEQRELAFSNSKNVYLSSLYRYNDLKKQLRFASQQSKKLLSISQTLTQDYIIKSQTEGRVYSIVKEVGEIINPQTPIAIIGNANDFILELQVDEYDIVKIKKGQKTWVTLDSYNGEVFEAEITNINPIMNEKSRTFKVEADFINKPPVLYPNLTLEANILLNERKEVLTIPRNYLIGDSLVLLLNKEKRKVQIGLKDYQKAEVLAGLSADDKIIMPAK